MGLADSINGVSNARHCGHNGDLETNPAPPQKKGEKSKASGIGRTMGAAVCSFRYSGKVMFEQSSAEGRKHVCISGVRVFQAEEQQVQRP